MSDEIKSLTDIVIHELRRQSDKLDKISDKQIEQGETLLRNTLSLEEHMRRTNLLESRFFHVEEEVDGLKAHVNKINFIMTILKPTKEKIKWLIILASIATGGYGTVELSKSYLNDEPSFIQKILNKEEIQELKKNSKEIQK